MSVSAPNGTIWVSDNGTGVSTLYGQDGTARSLVVTIPTAARNRGGGNPTGQVRNNTSFFQVTKMETRHPPFSFLSVKTVPSQVGTRRWIRTHAIIAVDNGTNRGVNRAIYKGATLGVANGHNFLYATDFHTGKVHTFDENFHQVNPNGFVDPNLPAGYATIRHPQFQWRNFCDLCASRITKGRMMSIVPAVASSTCSIPAATSSGA